MKDEIKEILELIGNCCYYGKISEDKCEKYCNYITNLQKENERLKENAEHNDKVVDKAKWNEMIYKSRNEKAIKCIKDFVCTEEYIKVDGIAISDNYLKLLDILEGKDYNKVERAYLDDEWIGEDKE